MKMSVAVEGFILSANAEGMSERTLELYKAQLARFTSWLDDAEIEAIQAHDLRRFLVWLRDDYRSPYGKQVSRKSVYNNWTAIRSFFKWAWKDGLVGENPCIEIPPPRFSSTQPDPFTEKEVKLLLKACTRPNTYDMLRERNYALIVFLLDTGVRSGELCALRIAHLDLASGRVVVKHGKGGKERFIYLGKTGRKALWRYLAEREDREDPASPVFLSFQNRPLTVNGITDLLTNLGEAAKVADCHAHRFRHTFAINFLRNGGDVFTLQRLLGHSSLDMVKRYVKLAEVDAEQAHKRASPADNWNL